MFMLENRWRREWRFRGRSIASIAFSHNLPHTTYSGSMRLYLRRLTVEWQIHRRGVSVNAHYTRKPKPIEQWTAREKREVGLVDFTAAGGKG